MSTQQSEMLKFFASDEFADMADGEARVLIEKYYEMEAEGKPQNA